MWSCRLDLWELLGQFTRKLKPKNQTPSVWAEKNHHKITFKQTYLSPQRCSSLGFCPLNFMLKLREMFKLLAPTSFSQCHFGFLGCIQQKLRSSCHGTGAVAWKGLHSLKRAISHTGLLHKTAAGILVVSNWIPYNTIRRHWHRWMFPAFLPGPVT